ncbi:hypothetical protein AAT19DRAFT_13772 [Rhodotorula toruloides]|uniref:Uncharacterized protein n=1 Tax=Rhodotorula toruloides TaxID=5286 RepID=A0A2T0A9Q2_RHOTO|nr:hypothetical protein AAT19DRAFT_13772 [Rhodotorula toruloides]
MTPINAVIPSQRPAFAFQRVLVAAARVLLLSTTPARWVLAEFSSVRSKGAPQGDEDTAGPRYTLGQTTRAGSRSADSPLAVLGDCWVCSASPLSSISSSTLDCHEMSDSSSYDGLRSRRRSEDPNALQRLPSTNSTEVKEMWKDVNEARRNDPFLPKMDSRPPSDFHEGDSQERLLQHIDTRQSRTHSRPNSAARHGFARSDSNGDLAQSWNTDERHGYTEDTTARCRDEYRNQPKPGPRVKAGEGSGAFIPIAKHRVKHVARTLLRHVATELGSTGEGRMARLQRKYNTKERRAEYKRDEERQEAYLRERAHSSGSLNLDSD